MVQKNDPDFSAKNICGTRMKRVLMCDHGFSFSTIDIDTDRNEALAELKQIKANHDNFVRLKYGDNNAV